MSKSKSPGGIRACACGMVRGGGVRQGSWVVEGKVGLRCGYEGEGEWRRGEG